ncbi:MAG: hypothetical protein JNK48_32165 [Bryobacterales bacterium]|nr:hypothetical protein [Bryobacterales bacterium]
MRRFPIRLLIPGLIEWSALAYLASWTPLERHIVEVIAILVVTSAVYLICCGLILKEPQSQKPAQAGAAPSMLRNSCAAGRPGALCGRVPQEPLQAYRLGVWIAVFAVLFRLTVVSLPPSFTDDVLRYRWEARVQLEGDSPYEVAPSDPAFARLRDETYPRISGPDFRAVYGPFTELAYRAAYRCTRGWAGGDALREVFWLKLPSMICDLALIAVLLRWRGKAALLYAWNPLPIFEFWVNGHNDSLMLLPLVLALFAAERARWGWAFTALGMAISAKIWPAALVPLFAGRNLARWKYTLLTAAVCAAWMAPFGLGLIRNGPFASGFLGGWRNNDSIYGLLLWTLGDAYRAKYAAAALVVVSVFWVTVRGWPISRACLAVITVLLLVSSNSHPWYLTWLLALLPAHPSLGLLLWTSLVPLAYQVLPAWENLGQWEGVSPLRWFIYVPVFLLLLYEWFASTWKNREKSQVH